MHKVLPNFMFIFFVAQSNQLQKTHPKTSFELREFICSRFTQIVMLKSSNTNITTHVYFGVLIFLFFSGAFRFDSGKNNNLETVVKSFKLILTDREHKIDRTRQVVSLSGVISLIPFFGKMYHFEHAFEESH